MVRINSRRLRATNNRYPTIVTHYCYLLFVSSLGVVFCFYLMLSSQEAKMDSIPMVVDAHSASSIASSGKPFLLYGTAWKKEETARYVAEAVHAGFRFIDTACQPKHYNEAGVGNGWKAAADELGLQRSDIYLQTKYTPYPGQDPKNVPYDHTAPIEEQVKQSLAVSLKNLHTGYLDSLVLHSPLDSVEKQWNTGESWNPLSTKAKCTDLESPTVTTTTFTRPFTIRQESSLRCFKIVSTRKVALIQNFVSFAKKREFGIR